MSGGRGDLELGVFHLKNQSGAVDRTTYAKLSDWISVKDYGAAGDGLTNDTDAINNAIAAAGSTQLLNFPCPGTYIHNTYGTLACGIYYPPYASSGAILRSVSTKLYEAVTVSDFGADPLGLVDSSTAIQAALDSGAKLVHVSAGTYLIGSLLTVPAGVVIQGDGPGNTELKKNYNGTMLDMTASYTGVANIYLNGNSASKTGDVVLISGGTAQRLLNVKFQCGGNAGNYAVEYTGVNAGTNSIIDDGEFNGTAFAVAVKYPDGPDNQAAPRTIVNSKGGGMIIIDFAGANDPVFIGNFTNGLTFSQTTVVNPVIIGNRIATNTATTTIKGQQAQIVGNQFAGPVIIDASASSTFFVSNIVPSNNVTDNGVNSTIMTQNINTPGTLTINSAGPHAIGGAASANARLRILGSYTGTTHTYGIENTDTIVAPVNGNNYAYGGFASLNKAGSGTHGQFAQMFLGAPTIGGGGAALTSASTLQIDGAPTGGTTNRAFWVQSGLSEFGGSLVPGARVVLTYSATIATDALLGNAFSITATNGTAFTISNPTNLKTGQRLLYTIRNTSGGAHGLITWGATFKTAAAALAVTTAFSKSIEYIYDGTNLIELWRSAADVAN